MRVIVTDTSFIWNSDSSALEAFEDVLLVVCLNGKAVSDKYECFVSPYQQVGMGIDKFGVDDQKYKSLEYVADDLNNLLGFHQDILFLTDGNPSSLYPFYVLKDRNVFNRLHLYTVSPWYFESKKCFQAHKELLLELSQLTSILYIDSNRYANRFLNENTTVVEVAKEMENDYMKFLPTVVNSIEKLRGNFYFDFATNSYVSVEEGFNGIDLSHINPLDIKIEKELYLTYITLGFVVANDYPEDDDITKEDVERVPARIDGKKVCEYLRDLRIKLAEANGIKFFSEECPSIGPCAGTCAKCDQESAYLREKLAEIAPKDRVIPNFTLSKWEVEL